VQKQVEKVLKGKKVLLTRPPEGMEEFHRKLDFEGAKVISRPLIELNAAKDQSKIDAALDKLEDFEWLVFNSPASVKFFFQRIEERGIKMYFYPDLKIATVGEKTKMKLEQLGYRTNFVPIEFTAEVLAANLPNVAGKQILIPASNLSGQDYIRAFEKRGGLPHQHVLYENRPIHLSEGEKKKIIDQIPDYLTFTSGSAVRSFDANFGNPQHSFYPAQVVCIGPSTAATAAELNWKIDSVAAPHTVEGMIQAMKRLEEQTP